MTTSTIYSREDLETLDLKALRRRFVSVVKKGPGIRKPSSLIQGILDAQAEAATTSADDKEVLGSAPDSTTPEVSSASEPAADENPEPEPLKVKLVGTGNLEGSTLLCDLISHTGAIAVVQVLGAEIRFRASSGEPVRLKKSWQQAGWVLDIGSMPEMGDVPVEQLLEAKTTDLSLDQLQALYTHLTARTSNSTSRPYLINRIRAAKAGTLPQGTRRSRSGEPTRVVPVAMAVSVVEKLDEAWKRNGYGSRISFIRAAMAEKLVGLGEDEVAAMFGEKASK